MGDDLIYATDCSVRVEDPRRLRRCLLLIIYLPLLHLTHSVLYNGPLNKSGPLSASGISYIRVRVLTMSHYLCYPRSCPLKFHQRHDL